MRDFLDAPNLESDTALQAVSGWNIKPTQNVCIAFQHGENVIASSARWWFVPHWYKGDVKEWRATTFNAKIETAHEKPTFRNAWQFGRCLIPAIGYYEWTGPKGKKQPWWITLEQNFPLIFFAGLQSVTADGRRTCTILTRAAKPEIADIHHRMPVILGAEQVMPWLNYEFESDQAIANLGCGWANRFLTRRVKPIGRDDDGPELIEPIDLAL